MFSRVPLRRAALAVVFAALPAAATRADLYPTDLLPPPGSALARAHEWVLDDTKIIRNLKLTAFSASIPQPKEPGGGLILDAQWTGDLLVAGAPTLNFQTPMTVNMAFSQYDVFPPNDWVYVWFIHAQSSAPGDVVTSVTVGWLGDLLVREVNAGFVIECPMGMATGLAPLSITISLNGESSSFTDFYTGFDWWLQAPEPSTFVLIALGGLAALRRRVR